MDASLSGAEVPPLPTTVASRPEITEGRTLFRLLVAVGVWVTALDRLTFDGDIGISVALAGVVALALLYLVRPPETWTRPRLVLWGLTLGALVQSAIDFNFGNTVSLLVLFSTLMVEPAAAALGAGVAAPWISGLSWLAAPLRWLMILEAAVDQFSTWDRKQKAAGWMRVLRILVPSAIVILPVFFLLAAGNPMLRNQLRDVLVVLDELFKLIAVPEIWRVVLWGFFGTLALSFFKPKVFGALAKWCVTPWQPRSTAVTGELTYARTVTILALSNLIFAWANATDIYYLWLRAELPPGTYYSAYLHEGVFALVTAALLSAGTLTYLFHQDGAVTSRRLPRQLVALWMLQALILVVSVSLRLKFYVDAYQLTILRCYVGLLLLAMVTGFGLLTYKIFAGKSLNWLVQATALTCFGILYTVQFVDVEGIIARYNTRLYLAGDRSKLNMPHLGRLGEAALPSLRLLEKEARDPLVRAEATTLLNEREKTWREQKKKSWRSWQARPYALQHACFDAPSAGESKP